MMSGRWLAVSALGIVWWLAHELMETLMGAPLIAEDPLGKPGSWGVTLILAIVWAAAVWLSRPGGQFWTTTAFVVGGLLCYVIATLHYVLPQMHTLRVVVLPWMTSAEGVAAQWLVPYNVLVYCGSLIGLAILWLGARALRRCGGQLVTLAPGVLLATVLVGAAWAGALASWSIVVSGETYRVGDLAPGVTAIAGLLVLTILASAGTAEMRRSRVSKR
jgi:hypothetical protein